MRRTRLLPAERRDGATPSAVQQVLPLTQAPTDTAKPRTVAPSTIERLWFCVWLPSLPLEAVAAGQSPAAVVEERQGVYRVLQTNAGAAGVRPGQSANAALALVPELSLRERSEVCEQRVLEMLATWLEGFSSFVSMAGKDVLVLEVAGSLRLFGGLPALRTEIARGLRKHGVTAMMAIAPTPLAATWLARSGRRSCIRARENLKPALRRLPLICLGWPETLYTALAGMGIDTVGDCLRLPREGFARRFGVEPLLQLDRALGVLPDPRNAWRAPERFCHDVEMTEEQSDRERLLGICHELLRLHEGFQLARQLGTQRLTFSFFHLKATATELQLGLAFADRAAGRWFDLLKLHFEQLRLPEPVIAVRLRSGLSQPLETPSARFSFDKGPDRSRHSPAQLLERLIARIGRDAVNTMTTIAEHRPERAWSLQAPLQGGTVASAICECRRPLWMLREPASLRVEAGSPQHDGGSLTLLEGPERLETGWWDEYGISRDYYTAVDTAGAHLWVFRNRRASRDWYLHGVFG